MIQKQHTLIPEIYSPLLDNRVNRPGLIRGAVVDVEGLGGVGLGDAGAYPSAPVRSQIYGPHMKAFHQTLKALKGSC